MLITLVVSNSLLPHGPQPARPLCPWDSSGKKTRVGFHFLLQYIFCVDIYIHTHTLHTHTHTYMYSFFIFFSIMVYHKILNMVLIHSMHHALHLLTPASRSIPSSTPLHLGNRQSTLCESVSVLQVGSFASYCRLHVQVISYDSCLSD